MGILSTVFRMFGRAKAVPNMPREDLPFCGCGTLESAASEPTIPIEFDGSLNEFNIRTTTGGIMRIYHCPFCAGRAPVSLRGRLFAEVTPAEVRRLYSLTKTLKTEADLVQALGQPTQVFDPGTIAATSSNTGEPPCFRASKTLLYEQHSDTATIHAEIADDGIIHFSFVGKYLSPP